MVEAKEDIKKAMKGVEINSRAGQEFLEKYDDPTRTQYRSCLKKYLAYRRDQGKHGIDCDFLKEEAEEDWRKGERKRDFTPEGWFTDFRKKMRNLEYSAHTIANVETCLRSFYRFHQYPLNTDRFTKTERLDDNTFKRIDSSEVARLYNSTTSKRNKALLLFLYQTGQAVKQVVSLKYGDVKKEIEAENEPLMIQYSGRKGRGIGYVAFLGTDGVHALRDYLEEREKKLGRSLKYDDVLFASQKDPEKGITQASVASMMKYLAKKSGLVDEEDLKHERNPYRPHAFRHNFKSQLATKCSNFVIEYMLGHRIGVEKDYFLADFHGKEGLREYYATNMEPELKVQATSREKRALVSGTLAGFAEEEFSEFWGREWEERREELEDGWRRERRKRKRLEYATQDLRSFRDRVRSQWANRIFTMVGNLRDLGIPAEELNKMLEDKCGWYDARDEWVCSKKHITREDVPWSLFENERMKEELGEPPSFEELKRELGSRPDRKKLLELDDYELSDLRLALEQIFEVKRFMASLDTASKSNSS